jgi:hypothetical protein
MWILPRQLHTSAFVPDTEALISDSTEQSQICAQSLLARSKPSPARTWSQRWKRDSWTQHLSGRILKPSHGPSFVTAWISSLAATLASHSAQPASDSEPKTHDTSGRTYQPELLSCDQVSVSLKTSRDISALGYPTLSKTWADWVTERRGAWRQRVNAARLTRGKESSSWLTISTEDACRAGSAEGWKEYEDGNRTTQARLRNQIHNWPTVTANEDSYRIGGESQQSKCLSAMARRGEMSVDWRTPTTEALGTGEHMDSAQLKLGARVYNKNGKLMAVDLNRQVEILRRQSGQAAPASSSTLGSRQGLWATPRSGKTTDENPETWALRQAKGDVATMPLTAQVKQWATPRTPTGGPESAQRKQELGRTTSGGGDLASQAMTQWPTPMTLAGPTETSNVSGSSEFTRKVDVLLGLRETTNGKRSPTAGRLNPRWVETLMGLPIGWTMPSCIRPVTIAPTSCDSLGTALCQPSQSERSDFLLAS